MNTTQRAIQSIHDKDSGKYESYVTAAKAHDVGIGTVNKVKALAKALPDSIPILFSGGMVQYQTHTRLVVTESVQLLTSLAKEFPLGRALMVQVPNTDSVDVPLVGVTISENDNIEHIEFLIDKLNNGKSLGILTKYLLKTARERF